MSMRPEHRLITLGEGETLTVWAGGESGPANMVRIDEWGRVSISCEYRRVEVVTIDPGPGGIQIFVDGEHEDGTP